MSTYNKDQPNSTKGTLKANVKGTDPEIPPTFDSDPDKLQFYEDSSGTKIRLFIGGTQTTGPQEDRRGIQVSIPDVEDDTQKTYQIKEQTSDTVAGAFIWESRGPGYTFFTATEGQVIVTINKKLKTAEGTFDFVAGSVSNSRIVETGKFNLEGMIESKKNDAIGSIEADIVGGIVENYKSTTVGLFREIGKYFPWHFRGWSEHLLHSSGYPKCVIAVYVAETLKSGTYNFSKDSQQVRALYMEVAVEGLKSFSAIEGTLQLESSPPEGSAQGKLVGEFNFTGHDESSDKKVQVKNGRFSIDNDQRAK